MSRPASYRARLAERLRELLDSSGISVSAVEKRLDHGRGYVADALRGNKKLSVETILEVLEAVGVSPEEFFERPNSGLAGRRARELPAAPDAAVARLRFPANASPVVRVMTLLLADEGLDPDELRDLRREVSTALRRKRAAR